MKNKIIVIFLLSLLVPNLAFAILYPSLGGTGPGTQYNPINVQISQDPYEQKRQENLSLESQLKAQYGYNIYISCKASVCGSYDYGDSYAVGSCLAQLESWLGMGYCQAQREQTIKNIQTVTPIAPVKTNDQICQGSFGSSSKWDGTKNNAGGLNCNCQTGYIWNGQRTSCVIAPIAPVKTNDQVCQSSFGSSSNWDGTKNNAGELNCSCKTGFVWNEQKNVCIIPPLKSNAQICIDNYGINSIWTGTLNTHYSPICECQTGYQWNQGGTQCVFAPKVEAGAVTPVNKTEPEIKSVQNEIKESVPNNNKDELLAPVNPDKEVVTNTEVVKPKSFWARLMGWFGF